MKTFTKLTTVLALGLVVGFSACKKTDSAANKPTNKTDYKALSQHIALSFAKSLNVGAAGFKTSATGGRRAFADIQCGQVVVTPYNQTITSGDTIRTYTGNSVFTYICNNDVLNEYSLVDTATAREIRTGFASTHRVIQNYNTRAVDFSYLKSTSNGTIGVAYAQRKFNNGGLTTDSLSYATQYTLNNVLVSRATSESVVDGGQATFTSSVFHKDNVVDVDGYSDAHTGVITFMAGYVFKVTFTQGNLSRSYLVNTQTGVVTEA